MKVFWFGLPSWMYCDLQPPGKCFAQELGLVVGTHGLRQATIVLDLLEHAHQTMRLIDVSTSVWSISRLKSSTTVKVRKRRPHARHRS